MYFNIFTLSPRGRERVGRGGIFQFFHSFFAKGGLGGFQDFSLPA